MTNVIELDASRVRVLMGHPDLSEGEVMPADLRAEQVVIGNAISKQHWRDEIGALKPSDFYWLEHQEIWASIQRHVDAGVPFDVDAIWEDVKTCEGIIEMGGMVYMLNLSGGSRSIQLGGALAAAHRVRALAKKRHGLYVACATANDLMDAPVDEPVEVTVGRALDEFSRLQSSVIPPSTTTRGQMLQAIVDRARDATVAPVRKVMTGLYDLDERLGGMRAGELHIIGARPGMGKTIVGANVAVNAALEGQGVIFFSMEMSAEQLTTRIICDMALREGSEVWIGTLRKGGVPDYHMPAITKAAQRLDGLPLMIDDKRGQSLADIAAKCRQQAREFEKAGTRLDLVVIDYMTLIQPSERYKGNKVAEVTELSRGLKILAGELGIPILALCQLNRGTEARTNQDARPRLSDLRESGSIEQDADSVTLLFREEYYVNQKRPANEATPEYATWQAGFIEVKDRLELIVAKNREGETGVIQCKIMARCAAVRDA